MGSYALLKVCGLAQSGFVMFGATLDIPLAAGVFPVLVVWDKDWSHVTPADSFYFTRHFFPVSCSLPLLYQGTVLGQLTCA